MFKSACTLTLSAVIALTLAACNANPVPTPSIALSPTAPATLPTLTPAAATTCLDLPRTVNGQTAHFELCGTPNTTGATKLATIHIFSRPEEVGLGGLAEQTIAVTQDTATPLTDPTSLVAEDLNFDGFTDFRVIEFLPAGPNIPYLYYLYDTASQQFVYSEAYHVITSPEVHPDTATIASPWRSSAAQWGLDTYALFEGAPLLTQRETWDLLDDGRIHHVIKVADLPDGNPQTVKLDEILLSDGTGTGNTGNTGNTGGTGSTQPTTHTVESGEWLLQIARCYGADVNELIQVNGPFYDLNYLAPGTVLTIPHPGAVSQNFGPPCIVKHALQAGDTWESIAQQYNADVAMLQRANAGVLTDPVLVPRNSATP